jgi:hypothetical protein
MPQFRVFRFRLLKNRDVGVGILQIVKKSWYAALALFASYSDLNTLIPGDSSLYLHQVESINDAGQITGNDYSRVRARRRGRRHGW